MDVKKFDKIALVGIISINLYCADLWFQAWNNDFSVLDETVNVNDH